MIKIILFAGVAVFIAFFILKRLPKKSGDRRISRRFIRKVEKEAAPATIKAAKVAGAKKREKMFEAILTDYYFKNPPTPDDPK